MKSTTFPPLPRQCNQYSQKQLIWKSCFNSWNNLVLYLVFQECKVGKQVCLIHSGIITGFKKKKKSLIFWIACSLLHPFCSNVYCTVPSPTLEYLLSCSFTFHCCIKERSFPLCFSRAFVPQAYWGTLPCQGFPFIREKKGKQNKPKLTLELPFGLQGFVY